MNCNGNFEETLLPWRGFSLSVIILSHPSLDLRKLSIDNVLDTRIHCTILHNEVGAMEATGNDIQRRRRPRHERSTRAETR